MSGPGLTTRSTLSALLYNLTHNLFGLANADLTLSEVSGTITATGAEQTLYIDSAPFGVFWPRTLVVDLDLMQGGDTTEFRVYYQIEAGGGLQLETYATYTGADGGLANSCKLISVALHPNRYGIQITLDQSAGVNRAYDWEVFLEV